MLPSHWPKWSLFFVALGIISATIVVALLLEPLGLALAPAVTPPPTMPAIHYARPQSQQCEQCHLDRANLEASGATPENIDEMLIGAESLDTTHGSLGCITCHGGNADQSDKDTAHEGLVADLTETHPESCLLCHRNLPGQFDEDHLRTPHGQVTNAVWEGSSCGVMCSDCHGQVGHGFDPTTGQNICPMAVCLDCHQERDLEDTLSECNACHLGPHEIAADVACKDCHASTDTWDDIILKKHSVELVGEHSTLDCFSCHRWPNFSGLDYGCSDCHTRPHEQGNDGCALCHSPEGWDSSAAIVVANATSYPHPVNGDSNCLKCHAATESHPMPNDHIGRVNEECKLCHTPKPVPPILHLLERRDRCLDCHDQDQEAPVPAESHLGYAEDVCRACHEISGAEPLEVMHSLEGREDCLMCHGPVRSNPFPESHAGWGTNLCLLCHESDEEATKTEHLFPLDHNGAAENCTLCHLDQDYENYTCEACHVRATVEVIHVERGIKLEIDCMICHPEGKKLLNSD